MTFGVLADISRYFQLAASYCGDSFVRPESEHVTILILKPNSEGSWVSPLSTRHVKFVSRIVARNKYDQLPSRHSRTSRNLRLEKLGKDSSEAM